MSDTSAQYESLLADGSVSKQVIRSGEGARPESGWNVGGN